MAFIDSIAPGLNKNWEDQKKRQGIGENMSKAPLMSVAPQMSVAPKPVAPPTMSIAPMASVPSVAPAVTPVRPPTMTAAAPTSGFNPAQDIARSQAAADAMKAAGTFPTAPVASGATGLNFTPPAAAPAPTATAPTATPTATNPSMNDIVAQGLAKFQAELGNKGYTDQSSVDQIRSKYGIAAPTTPATGATTSAVTQYGLTPEAIDAQLESEKQAIKNKYNIERQEAARITENERMSAFANLSSAGNFDPRSSGGANVSDAAMRNLERRNQIIAQAEQEELNQAQNRALGLKTKGMEATMTEKQNQEKSIQQQYENEQTAIKNAFDQNMKTIGTIIDLQNSNRQIAKDEQSGAQKAVTDLLASFGSAAFEGVPQDQIAILEKGAGYPSGSLVRGLKTMKEQELLGKSMNLKEVDGSLYNITTDADGNLKSQLIVKGTAKSDGGLTPAQINSTVNSIAGAFDNEPIVKNYNTTQEGYQTISTIGVDTKSPADDIAFIYAFAKIMDPNSVVREGEYNTIQKYAQSWAQNFGFSAKRIFSNSNFLSPDAKKKMLGALTPKIDTITNQYNNVRQEYQRQIDDAYAGKPRQITDYSTSAPPGTVGNDPRVETFRQQLLQEGFTPADVDAAIKEKFGFKPVASDTNDSSKIAAAIGQFESGGNYNERGVVVTKGPYKGQRAMGKYQIMPGNLPQWSREALGRVVSEREFMANPEIQDAIAEYKIEQYYKKHGNLEDVASVWFTGQPLAVASQRRDDLGTSGATYAKNVRSIYNNMV